VDVVGLLVGCKGCWGAKLKQVCVWFESNCCCSALGWGCVVLDWKGESVGDEARMMIILHCQTLFHSHSHIDTHKHKQTHIDTHTNDTTLTHTPFTNITHIDTHTHSTHSDNTGLGLCVGCLLLVGLLFVSDGGCERGNKGACDAMLFVLVGVVGVGEREFGKQERHTPCPIHTHTHSLIHTQTHTHTEQKQTTTQRFKQTNTHTHKQQRKAKQTSLSHQSTHTHTVSKTWMLVVEGNACCCSVVGCKSGPISLCLLLFVLCFLLGLV
jgi:hypothetical protein